MRQLLRYLRTWIERIVSEMPFSRRKPPAGHSYAEILRARAAKSFMSGDYRQAIEKFEKLCALTKHPKDHLWRAETLQLLGRYEAACDVFELVLRENPDDPFAMHHMAHIKSTCANPAIRDGSRAVALATRACEIAEWKNWVYLSVLAAAYAEVGDWPQAEHFATMALELAPDCEKERRKARLQQYRERQPYRSSPELDHSLLIRRDGAPLQPPEYLSAKTAQSSDRRIASLTQFVRLCSFVYFVSFLVLLVSALMDPMRSSFGMIVAVTASLVLFISGIAAVGAFTAREMIRWNRQQYRFSLRTLLIVTTEIALMLGLLALLLRA